MKLTKLEEVIMKQIHEGLCTDFSSPVFLPALSLRYGIRKRRMMELFKFIYGLTIYEHYLRCSMEFAKKRLLEGAQVKHVALELGYSTSGSFNRAFSRVHGKAPSAYIYLSPPDSKA